MINCVSGLDLEEKKSIAGMGGLDGRTLRIYIFQDSGVQW